MDPLVVEFLSASLLFSRTSGHSQEPAGPAPVVPEDSPEGPWPGCSCVDPHDREARLRILEAQVEPGAGEPGTLLDCGKNGPLVAAGREALRLVRVQPPGRKAMDGGAYLCGYRLNVGDRLG